jgi:ABC-type tungstate transport system permease subunit
LTDDIAFLAAFGTRQLWQIIGLSLAVSVSASVAATVIGLPAPNGKAKLAAAHTFADWLVSAEGQAAIGAYKMDGEQLFHPSAAGPK